jgi:hypothetical protein
MSALLGLSRGREFSFPDPQSLHPSSVMSSRHEAPWWVCPWELPCRHASSLGARGAGIQFFRLLAVALPLLNWGKAGKHGPFAQPYNPVSDAWCPRRCGWAPRRSSAGGSADPGLPAAHATEGLQRALPKDGTLIVYDPILDYERHSNAFGLLMSLHMLINSPGDSNTGARRAVPGFRRPASAPATSNTSPDPTR